MIESVLAMATMNMRVGSIAALTAMARPSTGATRVQVYGWYETMTVCGYLERRHEIEFGGSDRDTLTLTTVEYDWLIQEGFDKFGEGKTIINPNTGTPAYLGTHYTHHRYYTGTTKLVDYLVARDKAALDLSLLDRLWVRNVSNIDTGSEFVYKLQNSGQAERLVEEHNAAIRELVGAKKPQQVVVGVGNIQASGDVIFAKHITTLTM